MKQSYQLNVNLSDDIRRAFDEIEAATGLKDQAVTKALLCALVKYWKLHKQLTVPFELADSAGVIAETEPRCGARSAKRRRGVPSGAGE